jgi:hypothetical protein
MQDESRGMKCVCCGSKNLRLNGIDLKQGTEQSGLSYSTAAIYANSSGMSRGNLIGRHSKLPDPIVISRNDGDGPSYLEKQVESTLKRLNRDGRMNHHYSMIHSMV